MKSRPLTLFFLLYLTLLLIPGNPVGAQLWQWKTHTAKGMFRQLVCTEEAVWGATPGGLVAYFPETGLFSTWTNTEGLAINRVRAVAVGDEGRLWLGFENGELQALDPRRHAFRSYTDYQGHAITALFPYGDTLFVGLDIGVSLFVISREEVKETYKRLGTRFPHGIPVTALRVVRDTLWVGTDYGLAFTSLRRLNLLDPQNWKTLTTQEGLPANRVNALSDRGSFVYVGTPQGLYCLKGFHGEPHNTGIQDFEIRSIAALEETLYLLTGRGVYRGHKNEWQLVGPELFGGLSLTVHPRHGLFVGTSEGLALLSSNETAWHLVLPDGPFGNACTDLAVDRNGILWAASSVAGGWGFARFDGTCWRNYRSKDFPALPTDLVGCVAVDLSNRVWLGSFGGGAFCLEGDSLLTVYNTTNSLLMGFSGHETEPVVLDVACAPNGSVWFANFASYVGKPLVVRSPEGGWQAFGVMDGIGTVRIERVMVDSHGRIWIGSESNGVYVIDDGGTPLDRSDDAFLGTLTASDGLESLEISALAEDLDGTIWIGTKAGAYTYIVGEERVVYQPWIPSPNVYDIAVDGVGNVWIAHDAGVSYRMRNDYSWHHFHVNNSPLPSNRVFAVVGDPNSGKVYFGTDEGLSVLTTPFSKPRETMVPLRILPNPFKPSESSYVVIDELVEGVSVSIFTLSGFRIKAYPKSSIYGRFLLWDGRDELGKEVSSGIYLVVETAQDGKTRIGKLALIR